MGTGKTALRGLLICIALGWAGVAFAQDGSEGGVRKKDASGLGGVGDLDLMELIGLKVITVTAQKREENLQEIPTSVAAVRGERIDYVRVGGADMRFLSMRVPSLTIESSFGRTFPRLYIRGLGNPDFDLNSSQPVSTIMDGVVLENPTIKGFPIFDVDRIEVLRGPQGTLFGRNTPAGIVKFESRKPSDELEGYGRFTYGRFNYIGFEGATSGPLVDDVLSARMSLMYERRDGWVDNALTGEKNALEGFSDVAGRFQLLFTPTNNFRALLNVHAHSADGTARVFRANIINPGTDDFIDSYRRFAVSQDGQNTQKLTQYGMAADVQYDFGPLTLVSITGYETMNIFSRGDIDGGYGAVFLDPPFQGPGVIPFPSESADGIPDMFQATEELRIATNDWEYVNFQAGFFYFHENLTIDTFSFNTLAGGPQDGSAQQNQVTDAWALFASATYDVVESLRLAGGVRYSNDKKDFTASRAVSPFGAGPIGPLTANPEADFVSWDGSAFYTIVEDINVYGRIASGFRAPSIQGRVLFGDAISVADSEKILSFEAGLKSELFENRLRLNLAAFYYSLSDQQLTAVGGAANFNTLINADQTVGFGFELDGEVAATRDLTLTFGVSFNNTEIKDDALALAPCGSGCTVLDPLDANGDALINGNPLPHAPKWIGNVSARYNIRLGSRDRLFLFTNWSYRSAVNFFLYESEEYQDSGMVLGDLRIGYDRDDGQMEFSTFVSNVMNDNSRTGGIDFNNLTGFVNDPIIWGVESRIRY